MRSSNTGQVAIYKGKYQNNIARICAYEKMVGGYARVYRCAYLDKSFLFKGVELRLFVCLCIPFFSNFIYFIFCWGKGVYFY